MNRFIHYHSIAVLALDGRVLATCGAGGGLLFGNDASIEAFGPPYLFRGVRPRIANISTTDLVASGHFTMEVVNTTAVTKVALVGVRNSTHWVDGGPQRILPLSYTQNGSSLNVTLPSDTVRMLPGYYLLFAMVDDIPSVAGCGARPIPERREWGRLRQRAGLHRDSLRAGERQFFALSNRRQPHGRVGKHHPRFTAQRGICGK